MPPNDKLTTTNNGGLASPGLAAGKKPGIPGLHNRVNVAAQAAAQPGVDPTTLPNRIGLMLDCSGSMGNATDYNHGTPKIELLRSAFDSFVAGCDLSNTAVAVECFPPYDEYDGDSRKNERCSLALTTKHIYLSTFSLFFEPRGCTPMAQAMQRMIERQPITRGILISDGEADSPHGAREQAAIYKEASIPVDCIHIGTDVGGEELLRDIATRTGGIYMKFTDVAAFARSFHFLTPGGRGLLLSGQVGATQLGATSVEVAKP